MVELDHDIFMVSHVSFNGEASLYPALVDLRLRPGRPLVALALSGAAESALRMCTVQGEGTPSMGKNMFVVDGWMDGWMDRFDRWMDG